MTEKQGKRDRDGEIDRYEERERDREREREKKKTKDENSSNLLSHICTQTLTCWYD